MADFLHFPLINDPEQQCKRTIVISMTTVLQHNPKHAATRSSRSKSILPALAYLSLGLGGPVAVPAVARAEEPVASRVGAISAQLTLLAEPSWAKHAERALPLRSGLPSLGDAPVSAGTGIFLPDAIYLSHQEGAPPVSPPPVSDSPTPQKRTERVPLFFYRNATTLKTVLEAIEKTDGSTLKGLVIQAVGENQLALYGEPEKIREARRFIAVVDAPVPSVQLEVWGLQLSSTNPKQMTLVLQEVQESIEKARTSIRRTYQQLQKEAIRLAPDETLRSILADPLEGSKEPGLGYTTAFADNRELSVTDILLRLIAASDPADNVKFAQRLTDWTKSDPVLSLYAERAKKRKRKPFQRFFEARGLLLENDRWNAGPDLESYVFQARGEVLQFAGVYADSIDRPNEFSPYYLQTASGAINQRMQRAINLLMEDIYDLFMEPTLEDIRFHVENFKDVEYSQVGRIQVSSLNGVPTKVTGTSVSAFDVTPPLPVSELLEKLTDPAKITPEQQVALLAVLTKNRTQWRELNQGISFDFTPNVLRNATSAELAVHLTISDPQAGTREAGVRPLSRVGKHELENTIYLNALDIFDLSTFSSEAALEGGRDYFPLIGPLWKGVFGDFPLLGNLFSWKRGPKHVYHHSVLLSNAIVNPTTTGIALLYPHRTFRANTAASVQGREAQEDVRKKRRAQLIQRLEACTKQKMFMN